MSQLIASNMATSILAATLQADDGGGIPWWVWVILIIVLLLLLLIGFARQPEPGEPLPEAEERATPPVAVNREMGQDDEPEPGTTEDDEPKPPDDLKRIEGIGPKIASILNENDINTFEALAAAGPEHLEALLDEAGINLAFPESWPEQARLAAAGKWEELGKLQDDLKGGRKD